MLLSFKDNQLIVDLTLEEQEIVNWMFSRNEHHVVQFVINELLNQRKDQMLHEEKEAVWTAHLESKKI
jgi:hypothetical protein